MIKKRKERIINNQLEIKQFQKELVDVSKKLTKYSKLWKPKPQIKKPKTRKTQTSKSPTPKTPTPKTPTTKPNQLLNHLTEPEPKHHVFSPTPKPPNLN